MYPRISDLFSDLLGFNFPIPIYSFGAMVAVAILTASWITGKELDRMYAAGIVKSVKLPEAKKKKGKGKKTVKTEQSPSALIGTVTIIAVVAGFAGSKIFHILENLGEFAANPFGMLFSTGGFTFYGGLIVAAICIALYIRKYGLSVRRFADAIAPSLILGYGIGRIGCHLAGDGDWGIPADIAAKPDWLPMWLWAETYPNNILNIDLSGAAVYPTSIYEFVAGLLLFAVLWAVRKHPFQSGWLFSLYLVFAGLERFFIEKIRVNNEFELFGAIMTQAELISILMIVLGVVGIGLTMRKTGNSLSDPASGAVSA
ncbi:MAG: prolipoprotein diacylglyceryl transferase [Rhodothermales bacterium]|nr:prolipoprotein diacylglyceryl transferase [Rhodothermales bacterium]